MLRHSQRAPAADTCWPARTDHPAANRLTARLGPPGRLAAYISPAPGARTLSSGAEPASRSLLGAFRVSDRPFVLVVAAPAAAGRPCCAVAEGISDRLSVGTPGLISSHTPCPPCINISSNCSLVLCFEVCCRERCQSL